MSAIALTFSIGSGEREVAERVKAHAGRAARNVKLYSEQIREVERAALACRRNGNSETFAKEYAEDHAERLARANRERQEAQV